MEYALASFRQVEQTVDAEKVILAWAALERGRIFDLGGEREKALSEYEKVIPLMADPETIRLARAYKGDPYRLEVNSSPKPQTPGLKSGGGGAN